MEENNTTGYYRKVRDVVRESYVVGSYQRGYRWTRENINEFLDDIFEGKLFEDYSSYQFKTSSGVELIGDLRDQNKKYACDEYCLQPLVLKRINEGYSVIDGQQRLTTLYIVIKAIDSVFYNEKKIFNKIGFSIDYKSRPKTKEFLENISSDSNPTDIDSAYIKEIYEYAKIWFREKYNTFIRLLGENFDPQEDKPVYASYLWKEILCDQTKFIWDDVSESSSKNKDEQKIFADRNTGKLDLTESELIKSIFMNPEYYGEETSSLKDRQILISELWDIYENELHREEFWEFIPVPSGRKKEYQNQTRIDALFWIFAKKNNISLNEYENNSLFKSINDWINKRIDDKEINKNKYDNKYEVMCSVWRSISDLFDGIKELFDENELYNLMSLLKEVIENLEGNPSETLLQVYFDVLSKPRNLRAECIKSEIIKTLFPSGIEEGIKSIRYGNDSCEKMRNILLAHNVAVTNSSNPIFRFSFQMFDETKWDREHIYSTNENYLKNASADERIRVLEMFESSKDNSYKSYLEYLYSISIDEENQIVEDMNKKTLLDNTVKTDSFLSRCFEKSNERYDIFFDVWRFLKLKEKAGVFLEKYEIKKKLSEVLESSDFCKAAESFLHEKNDLLYDGEEFKILRAEYLYWDDEIESLYNKEKDKQPKSIMWHGDDIDISSMKNFWTDEINKSNFRHNYYRRIIRMIYDNSGIPDPSIKTHGPLKKEIVDENNSNIFRGLFTGTIYRIDKDIDSFFEKDEHINPLEKGKDIQESYNKFAHFVNDNSMGNMMLLPKELNRKPDYSNASFDKKRKIASDFKDDQNNLIFLPIASSQVLMGKYTDSNSSGQWLMAERKKYLEDMIDIMKKYFEVKCDE